MERLAVGEEEGEEEEGEGAVYVRQRSRSRRGQPCPYLNEEPYWYSVIKYSGYEMLEDIVEEAEEDSDDELQNYPYTTFLEDIGEEAEEDSDDNKVQNGPYPTFCGFRRAFLYPPSVPIRPQSSNLDLALLGLALPQKPQLTAEEAEQNAKLLVAEEERLKKKAEKKRMKKKRQKDRKRQEKRNLELKAKNEANNSSAGQDEGTLTLSDGLPDSEGSFNEASPGRSPSSSLEEVEVAEDELDFSSTFVSKARRKLDAQSLLPRKEKEGKNTRERKAETKQKAEKPSELQLSPMEQSLVLADCGNETAKQGLFHQAVHLFTEAIKLNPQEYRFFGNRSFCYEKLQSHAAALRDAQQALILQPGWPRGLFRQGKALLGLKQYAEAARTFQQLLPFDGFRGDAAIQLQKCQIQHSLESRLGCFHRNWDTLPVETQLPLPGNQPGGQRCPDSIAQAIATTRLAPPVANAPGTGSPSGWGTWCPRSPRMFCFAIFGRLDPLTASGASLTSTVPSSTTATRRPPKPPTWPCRCGSSLPPSLPPLALRWRSGGGLRIVSAPVSPGPPAAGWRACLKRNRLWPSAFRLPGGGSGRMQAYSAAEAPRACHCARLQGSPPPRPLLGVKTRRTDVEACTDVLGGPGGRPGSCGERGGS